MYIYLMMGLSWDFIFWTNTQTTKIKKFFFAHKVNVYLKGPIFVKLHTFNYLINATYVFFICTFSACRFLL